ncbi:hypothetical protein COU58_04625 [Candidatus Pacearchaeota archaeon CG10_big_fil_rev_8_21_14_0_10_32_42]|nr:MAG: hypothetical protein COU58_04625 [Candidatus Pacearchaeota archaeon CG10_big_fil_rev_8_21_14_0_10_32_42]
MVSEVDNYIKMLRSLSKKDIKMGSSKRKDVWEYQEGRCAVCKKDLKIYYSKYIEDKKTGSIKVICSDCTIKTGKRN